MKSQCKVAVIQDSSVPFDAQATAKKACRLLNEAANNGAELAVFPEAFLGSYPKGLSFDAPVGTRLPEGREVLCATMMALSISTERSLQD